MEELSRVKPEYFQPTRNLDLTKVILEEIALEGLDGITFQALFARLSKRPGFKYPTDDSSKPYIWNLAKRLKSISLFILKEPRTVLDIQDRRDFVDEKGSMYEPISAPEDIYEYYAVDDREIGVRGSCKDYYTRKPCTGLARRLSYTKIYEMYGNKLVMVAPQNLREQMMLSRDVAIDFKELSIIQYCLLERIARARYAGEITKGKVSLGTMKIDPKSLFYQRKMLLKKGLIVKQSFSMKYGPARSTATVTILHLPKFYTYYETMLKRGISMTIKSILNAPYQQREIAELRVVFGKHSVKHYLSKDYSEIFEQMDVPFSKLHPEIYTQEKSAEKREKMEKRMVKLVRLRDHRINHINFVKLMPKAGDEKEEVEESVVSAVLPIRNFTTQTTVLYDFIRHVVAMKAQGSSLGELSEQNQVTLLDSRSAVRFLQRHKIVIPVLVDRKKTKMNRYVFFKFIEANKNVQNISMYTSEVPRQPDSQKFIDLEPGTEVEEVGIEWTVPQLDLVSSIPFVDLESEVPVMSSLLRSKNILKKKRRGSSYKSQTENISLKLCAEVRNVIDEFVTHMNPDTDEMSYIIDPSELRFNRGEGNDFVAVQDKKRAKCLVYMNPAGWHVVIEKAEVRIDTGKIASFSTRKNTERGNFILDLIYRHKIVLGFQQILRKIRIHETSLTLPTEEKSHIDRRTVYRMLRQLQKCQLIQILRVCIQRKQATKICALFLPFCVPVDSRLVASAIEFIVSTAQGKTRFTIEERRANETRNRLIKKPKRLAKENQVEETTVTTNQASRKIRSVAKRVKTLKRKLVKPKLPPRNSRVYDDTDRAALARMKRVRVDWTQKEDRYVLCIFLASVLFIPRYNHQKIFMFNSHQIRDILHLKLEEGKTKTALAIRRRLHFLMKKTSFFNRYRYYLTEAMTDNVLRQKYLKNFHDRPTQKIFFKIPMKSLLGVVDYLQQKFRKLNVETNIDGKAKGSDSVGQSKLDVVLYENPNDPSTDAKLNHIRYVFQQTPQCIMVDCLDTPYDVNSIFVWTARTAILSLILSGDDVQNVHRFLGSIPDKVLSYSLNAMRVIGLTSWQKQHSRFGPSLLLRRMLHMHLSVEKYHQSHALLQELSQETRETFNAANQGTAGGFVLLAELHSRNLLKFSIRLPDPMVTIDPEWEDMFQSILDGVNDNTLKNEASNLIDYDAKDLTYKLKPNALRKRRLSGNKSANSAKKYKAASVDNQNKSDSVLILENVVNQQKDLQEALRTGSTTARSSKALRMSNKAMRVIRSQINSKEKGNFIHRDFFTVNLPEISVDTNKNLFARVISERASPKLGLEDIKRHLIKITLCTRLKSNSGKVYSLKMPRPKGLGNWEKLYDFISSTKDIGVSARFLLTKFTRKTLSDGLRFLIVNNSIYLVGVTYRKFVSVEHVDKWTMPIPDLNDSSIIKKVIFRPWINYAGGVNWDLVDQSLSAVLGFISLYPEVSVEDLCDYFSPVISPVETMILIDALVGLEFLNLYAVENKVDVGAFTSPSIVSKNYNVDTFLDLETLYIELNSLTVSKYSKLQALFSYDPEKLTVQV